MKKGLALLLSLIHICTYYHLDATFDNTLGKSDKVEDIRYDYFNLDDKQIFKDHEPLIAAAPHCTCLLYTS